MEVPFRTRGASLPRALFSTGKLAVSAILLILLSVPAFPAFYSGTNTGAITDGNAGTPPQCGPARDVSFNVSGLLSAGSASVAFTMNHGYVGDLQLTLIAPNSASMILMSRVGATAAVPFGDNSNLNGTYTFSDTGTGGIWAAAAGVNGNQNVPAGTYRTQAAGPFTSANPGPAFTSMNGVFGGPNPNGTWILRFQDCAASDTGSVTAATLTLQGPLAAEAVVSGRVVTADGAGVRNAMVTIAGGNLSEPIVARTGPFGFYSFEVPAGQSYVLSVRSKQFFFAESTRVINLGEDFAELDFVALPIGEVKQAPQQ